MGSIYYENVMGKKQPTVGIVNIGSEEEKGNQLVKDTFPLLKECKDIHFVGNIEAREIPGGACDVIVTEAFVGNVILKLFEGLAMTLLGSLKKGFLSNTRSKIGAILLKPALKKTLKQFDVSEQGGAPLLGLKGLVVKAHGNAKSLDTKCAIIQCLTFKKQNINEKFQQIVKEEKSE
jgi:glycerol-3-phosphate acyltransferase PlsX